MKSFPHNLVLDSQPRFGLTQSEFLSLYNFLTNKRIFMKIVAKCLTLVSLWYQVHVQVCNPIPLNKSFAHKKLPFQESLYLKEYRQSKF